MRSLGHELLLAFKAPAPYLSWLALTAVLALTGPYDTYMRFPLAERLVYFGAVVGLCIALGTVARVAVQYGLPSISFWRASLVVVTVCSLLLAWPLHGFAVFMAGEARTTTPTVLEIGSLIFAIGLGVASVRWATRRELDGAGGTQPPAGKPRLFDRLDKALHGELIRISGRGHYTEVVTEKGQAQVLLRFSDALAEVGEVDGLQVHRSHWVAMSAIVGVEKLDERRQLLLRDGSRVPISRGQLPAVRARGLL